MAGIIKTNDRAKVAARFLPLITVALAIAYGVAAYLLLILPKVSVVLSGARTEIAQLRAGIAGDSVYATELENQVKDFLTLNTGKKTKVHRTMPLSVQTPELFVMFDTIARDNGLSLTSIDTAADPGSIGPDGVVPVRVSFSVAGGSYSAFRNFLHGVEQNERLSDVQSIMFAPSAGSYSIVLRTYYVDPALAAGAKTPVSRR